MAIIWGQEPVPLTLRHYVSNDPNHQLNRWNLKWQKLETVPR